MDCLTPEQRKKNMSAIKGRDTKPEILLRKLLHRLGYRFRIQRKDLPGRPDIVLPRSSRGTFVPLSHHRTCELPHTAVSNQRLRS